MSAVSQLGVRLAESTSTGDSEMQITVAALGRSDPPVLDPAQAAVLLTECQKFLEQDQFDNAFQILEAALEAYPDDPALVKCRCEMEERQRAFVRGTQVKAVLQRSQWLLDNDRPDLAAALVKERLAELRHHPALISRLHIVETMLPAWEKKRDVRNALELSDALEQLHQWQWALTILEEALQSYPDSEELAAAAKRVRERFDEREREKRLARRLKLIRQRIANQSWRPALALLEETLKEFPAAPELEMASREVDAGMRRSEREAVVTEVRQCMADGELELACQALSKGMESLGEEPPLESLRKELEGELKYREELRTAQGLVGRRQLQEAESVLEHLAMQDRPEAQALLVAVKKARAADDEANFCEGGRKKALKLLEQQQFAQAADLLSNLRALFPDNPMLERDYLAAQDALGRHAPAAAAPVNEERSKSEPVPVPLQKPLPTLSVPLLPRLAVPELEDPPDGLTVLAGASERPRRGLVAGAKSLLFALAGAAWEMSRNGTAPSERSTAPMVTPVISVQSSPAGPAAAKDGNHQEAQLVDWTLPDYPALARQRGIAGDVQMEARVDENGAVKSVKVLSGDEILAAAARNAVLTWKYKPAALSGWPIAATLTVQVTFQDRNK